MDKSTRIVHPPQVQVPADNRPLVAPIYQSVKFELDTTAETQALLRGARDGYFYQRTSNPTLRQLELTLAELQQQEEGLLVSSGAGAMAACLTALCKAGDHILGFIESYAPTRHFIARILGRYGVTHEWVSIEDRSAIERALAARATRAVVFESPTNPITKIADLEHLIAAAQSAGALTIMDNTFAGFHNHGRLGIDVHVHSLTKYASGHGDVMGGAILTSSRIARGMRKDLSVLGNTLDPHAAFLIQRGMRTYFVRYARQCESALGVARFLRQQAQVARVFYPGLPDHPQHALAARQMSDFGTVVAFELRAGAGAGAGAGASAGAGAGADRSSALADALQLFAISASIGSTESLVMPSALLMPLDLNEAERAAAWLSEGTVRLSIGLEHADDLIADLAQALRRL